MKQIYKEKTKQLITEGINELADIVRVTLGGKGKNVVLENQFGKITIINDGTTIANAVEFEEPIKNAGATLAKQVAHKTNEEAGDGTTTSIVLLQAFLKEMDKVKTKDSRGLREEIRKVVDQVISKLDKMKRKVGHRDIERIAKISSLDDEMAKTIARVIKKIGKDGVVNIEESKVAGISTEVVNGVRVDRGFLNTLMVTDTAANKSEVNDTAVLVTRKKISFVQDIVPIMQHLGSSQRNRLVIFCEDISEEVLTMLVLNKIQGNFLTLVVKTNDLDDIATVTGAQVVTDQNDLQFIPDVLGNAGKVVSTKYHTTIIDGKQEQSVIDEKIEELKKMEANEETPYEKDMLKKRVARLMGGVSIIKIGGENEVETTEKKLKLEDAVNAVKAAMEDGIVEGGGLALYKVALQMVKEVERRGLTEAEQLVHNVIITPFFQVLDNAEIDGDKQHDICEAVEQLDAGYNVVADRLENFFESGVIDPVKVTKSALKNAFSMGMMILTSEAAIVNKPQEQK